MDQNEQRALRGDFFGMKSSLSYLEPENWKSSIQEFWKVLGSGCTEIIKSALVLYEFEIDQDQELDKKFYT